MTKPNGTSKKAARPRTKPKRGVPTILPREPLTNKALEAISQYATIKAQRKGLHIHYFMVKWVLEAERMRRRDLYAWLEQRGYRWLSKQNSWEKQGGKKKES